VGNNVTEKSKILRRISSNETFTFFWLLRKKIEIKLK
jgi:hypothetical protein